MLLRDQHSNLTIILSVIDPLNTSIGKVCFSTIRRKNNRAIQALFQEEAVTVPYVISYWNGFVDSIPWKKLWT